MPDLLPGEDRTLGEGLFVDLVPSSCWFTNVRSCVTPRGWERLRRMITRRAGMSCEACGAGEDRTARRWLEAHERWWYDEQALVQHLKRLICLCTDCHTVTHYGLAQVRGLESKAFAHLTKVTKMDGVSARRHIDAAFAVWRRRSAVAWELDLSILTDAGITLKRPPTANERPGVAAARIAVERGIALPSPTPPSPRRMSAVAHQPVDHTVPAPRGEGGSSFLRRLFRRNKR